MSSAGQDNTRSSGIVYLAPGEESVSSPRPHLFLLLYCLTFYQVTQTV